MTKNEIVKAEIVKRLFFSRNASCVDGWTRIASQETFSTDGMQYYLLILSCKRGLFGVEYAYGLTGDRESEFPWDPDPWTNIAAPNIELKPMIARVVTSTRYRTA